MKRIPWDHLQPNRPGTPAQVSREEEAAYGDFSAAELYCPRCKMAAPVRERLLLILPDGELYEYLCVRCGMSVGEKRAKGNENIKIVMA